MDLCLTPARKPAASGVLMPVTSFSQISYAKKKNDKDADVAGTHFLTGALL
jgi:hypothetical protein